MSPLRRHLPNAALPNDLNKAERGSLLQEPLLNGSPCIALPEASWFEALACTRMGMGGLGEEHAQMLSMGKEAGLDWGPSFLVQ